MDLIRGDSAKMLSNCDYLKSVAYLNLIDCFCFVFD
jgi:hypothetical protein